MFSLWISSFSTMPNIDTIGNYHAQGDAKYWQVIVLNHENGEIYYGLSKPPKVTRITSDMIQKNTFVDSNLAIM